MNKESILFVCDCDDTLILSSSILIPFYQQVTEEGGFGCSGACYWLNNWGKSLEDIIIGCYPNLNTEQKVAEACRYIRERVRNVKLPPIIGGPRAIELLYQKFHLGVLTSRKNFVHERLIDAGYSLEHFEFIITQADKEFRKPDKRAATPIIQWAQNNDIIEWLYIGDSLIDLQFANNVGVPFLAVTSGLTSREEFLAAGQPEDLVFPSIVEVADYLLQIAYNPFCRECEECKKTAEGICRFA